jgi:hypothetical protein
MIRVSFLLAAVAFCIWQAPGPDPRWLAAVSSSLASFLPNGPSSPAVSQYPDLDFRCPMDPDVHSRSPMKCPRCGMTLVKGIVEPVEYPLNLTMEPQRIEPDENVLLNFGIVDPRTRNPVREFEVVHEKLYHLFVVSQDLKFFLHTHPERQPDSDFHLNMRFPKAGMYRLLSDFYPAGGTPQLIVNTVMVPGEGFAFAPAKLDPDLGPQRSENAGVELEIAGPTPSAGKSAALNFRVRPNDGIEPYLGAMAHMLAASSDLVDMIHQHPFQATDARWSGYKQLQFNMTFPRPGVYRVWVQFQRKGVVNTVAFNVPVAPYR